MEKNELKKIISEIKAFEGLTDSQISKIINICHEKELDVSKHVFVQGQPAVEMLILLDGELEIKQKDHTINYVQKLDVVGEMGVLTNNVRSADVFALRNSKVLSIERKNLLELMESDKNIGFIIYRNVTAILAEYLRSSNQLLEIYHITK